jgi:hypothetical protein
MLADFTTDMDIFWFFVSYDHCVFAFEWPCKRTVDMKWEQSWTEAANNRRKNVQSRLHTNWNTERLDTAIKIHAAAVTEQVKTAEGHGRDGKNLVSHPHLLFSRDCFLSGTSLPLEARVCCSELMYVADRNCSVPWCFECRGLLVLNCEKETSGRGFVQFVSHKITVVQGQATNANVYLWMKGNRLFEFKKHNRRNEAAWVWANGVESWQRNCEVKDDVTGLGYCAFSVTIR